MSESGFGPENVAALLLELARAHRARKFYPPGHPALNDALERSTTVWRDALPRDRELQLEIKKGSFVLPGGAPVHGPGIDDVAADLRARRVRRLRIHPDLESDELMALVEALAEDAEQQLAAGGFEQTLLQAHVRHITTSEIDFAEHFSRLPAPGSEDGLGLDDGSTLEVEAADEALASAGMMEQLVTFGDEPAPEAVDAEVEAQFDSTVSLLRQLGKLEKCDVYVRYYELSQGIQETVWSLIASNNLVDAYRAVLVYARHASEADTREFEIRQEAESRLRELTDSREMLNLILEHASSGGGLTAVQATQVLTCLGSRVVRYLLEQHESCSTVVQRQTGSILIAMGDEAFPLIVDELAYSDPTRVRRAIRLLGGMQNPRGIEFLLNKLRDPDVEIRQEAAKALARIGTDSAVQGLVSALEADTDAAGIVATCLGNTRNVAATRALSELVDESSGYPDNVRREALRSLGRIGSPLAFGALQKVLDRKAFFGRKRMRPLRIAAAQAIGRIGGPEAVQALAKHTRGGDRAVQKLCRELILRLTSGATEPDSA